MNGEVLRTFPVLRPHYLSLDSEGHLLVAEWGNHRILLMNSQLQLERVLVNTDSEVKLWRPERLSYNQLTGQLYVLHGSSSAGTSSHVISQFSLR